MIKKFLNYTSESFKNEKTDLPELNGIRAIAIILVILHHCYLAVGSASFSKYKYANIFSKIFSKICENGRMGVDIFFVLSGFLIGGQLLKNIIENNKIELKKFYLKRIFRIFPAYYFCLIIFIILFYGIENLSIQKFISHLLYFQNYWYNIYEITWSLAVEEQFYLILPFLLFIFKDKMRSSNKYVLILFSVIILIPFANRCIIYSKLTNIFDSKMIGLKIFGAFHTRFDQLFIGVLCAYIYYKFRFRMNNKMFVLITQYLSACLFLVLIYYSGMNGSFYKIVIQFTLIGISVGIFILSSVLIKSFISKILSLKIFGFIARISYPLYLYHYFSIWIIDKNKFFITQNIWINFMFYIYGIFIFSILISLLSWLFIEYPFIIIKRRMK